MHPFLWDFTLLNNLNDQFQKKKYIRNLTMFDLKDKNKH